MAVCRFCSTCLDAKHRYALFSKDAVEKNLPEKFSKLLQLPVSAEDGLSLYYCRKCVGKLNSIEKSIAEMRSLASSSYSKAGYGHSPRSGASNTCTGSPRAQSNSRKRVKDTSGLGASPHTTQARPVAKRALGASGRRLTYSASNTGKSLVYNSHIIYLHAKISTLCCFN